MRLIDADALMEVYTRHEFSSDMGDAIEILDNFSTMDAVPVRHGKWVIGTVPYFVCSECKSRTPLRWDERLGYVLDYQSPYCPNCGAKMNAERKEE